MVERRPVLDVLSHIVLVLGVLVVAFPLWVTFVASTQTLEQGMPIPVVITCYADRSFTFITKTPPASYFLRKAAGIDKGSQTPGRGFVGKVTMTQVRQIAEQKMADLNAADIDAAAEMIRGSARSMGLEVVE